MSKQYTDTFLSDTEKDLVAGFVENEPMRSAVKKVLLAGAYQNGVMKMGEPFEPFMNIAFGLVDQNKVYTDKEREALGMDLLLLRQASLAVELAFNAMDEYKREVVESPKENEAK